MNEKDEGDARAQRLETAESIRIREFHYMWGPCMQSRSIPTAPFTMLAKYGVIRALFRSDLISPIQA